MVEIVWVAAKPVPEDEVTQVFVAVWAEHVQGDVVVFCPEAAVLVPVWLAGAQRVSGGGQGWDVGVLVGRIGDDQVDVYAILRGQPWHGGGADVFDGEGSCAQRCPDTGLFSQVVCRPARVVGADSDGLGHLGRAVTDDASRHLSWRERR